MSTVAEKLEITLDELSAECQTAEQRLTKVQGHQVGFMQQVSADQKAATREVVGRIQKGSEGFGDLQQALAYSPAPGLGMSGGYVEPEITGPGCDNVPVDSVD